MRARERRKLKAKRGRFRRDLVDFFGVAASSRDAKERPREDAREFVAPVVGRHGGGVVRIGVLEAQ
jgi:hypothetical protein